jgi:hypothetical protein
LIAGDFRGGWRGRGAGCCVCGGVAEARGSYKNAGLKVPSRLGWLDRGGIATGSSERTGCSRFYDSTGDAWGLVGEGGSGAVRWGKRWGRGFLGGV